MTLTLATSDEKLARDAVTHAAWGQKLTVEQYLTREARLRAHAWTRTGMETWLLRDDAGAVLSSCESFACDSRLEGAPGTSYAIASVYTEPHLRGKGHAVAMMDALGEALGARSATQSIVLFSDVGAAIYGRSGYVAVESRDRVLGVEAGDPAAGVDALLDERDLAAHVPAAPVDEPFVVWPSAAQLDWHLERERIYAELLARPRAPFVGAKAGDALALWTADLKNDRLALLLVEGRRGDEVAAVLAAARRVAHAIGVREVRAWTDARVEASWPSGLGRLETREGGLSMIRPVAPGLTAASWRAVPRALWV